MSWKIIIYFKDKGTHELGYIDSLEGATEKIHNIFEEGLTIQTANHYSYYPPEQFKMGEATKTE